MDKSLNQEEEEVMPSFFKSLKSKESNPLPRGRKRKDLPPYRKTNQAMAQHSL